MKHFRAYRNAGAMVNVHISRLHKDGGRLEQRIMEHYKEKKVRTWRARGLTNVRRRRGAKIEASRVMHTSSLEFVELGSARRPAVLLALTTHRFDTHITRRRIAHALASAVWLTYLYLAERERFSSSRKKDGDVAVPAVRSQGRGWGGKILLPGPYNRGLVGW